MFYVLLNQLFLIHIQILHFLLNADEKVKFYLPEAEDLGPGVNQRVKADPFENILSWNGLKDDDSDAPILEKMFSS